MIPVFVSVLPVIFVPVESSILGEVFNAGLNPVTTLLPAAAGKNARVVNPEICVNVSP